MSSLKATSQDSNASKLFSLAIFALFIAALLLTLVAGVRVYSAINEGRAISDDQRMSHGFLINSIRASDSAGSIFIGEGPEGSVLIMSEPSVVGMLETRIYKYDDAIVQEYVKSDAPYSPEDATEIFKSNTFKLDYNAGLLSVTTDYGTSDIALRSNVMNRTES